MHYSTIIGYILATSSLAIADSDSDSGGRWGLEFFTEGACGIGHSSFSDNKICECTNIVLGAEITSFGWDADDCDFDLNVFFEKDCRGHSDRNFWNCNQANSFRNQSYRSFLVSLSLLNMASQQASNGNIYLTYWLIC